MKSGVLIRYILAIMLLLATISPLSVSFAQDEETDDDTWGEWDDGVGGIEEATDAFDVPAQPTPETAAPIVNAQPNTDVSTNNPQTTNWDTSTDFNTASPAPAVIQNNPFANVVQLNVVLWKGIPNVVRIRTKPIRDTGNPSPSPQQANGVIWEYADNRFDTFITVYDDYSLIFVDSEGEEFFSGQLGVNAAGAIIIVGTDPIGNRYAYVLGYVMVLTVNQDVLLGDIDVLYIYDYDADGNLVSLTDSNDNEYTLETDEDGNIFITDAEGNMGEFYADGTYALYDEAGNIFDEGALFGDDDKSDDFVDDDDGIDGYGDDDVNGYGGDDGYGGNIDGDGGDDSGYGDQLDGYGGDNVDGGDIDGYGDDDSDGYGGDDGDGYGGDDEG